MLQHTLRDNAMPRFALEEKDNINIIIINIAD
jgi:hypothetical protein